MMPSPEPAPTESIRFQRANGCEKMRIGFADERRDSGLLKRPRDHGGERLARKSAPAERRQH